MSKEIPERMTDLEKSVEELSALVEEFGKALDSVLLPNAETNDNHEQSVRESCHSLLGQRLDSVVSVVASVNKSLRDLGQRLGL